MGNYHPSAGSSGLWLVGSSLTIGDNTFSLHGLWSGMRTNSKWRESAFSSHVFTRPLDRIQNTCWILWRKNYPLACIRLEREHGQAEPQLSRTSSFVVRFALLGRSTA